MKRLFLFSALLLSFAGRAQTFVSFKTGSGLFPVVSSEAAAIYTDPNDDWLVTKTATLLQADIEMVTGKKPQLLTSLSGAPKMLIIIGTINRSSIIKDLAAAGKISTRSIKNNWEAFQIQTVSKPVSGVENALVIAGSDKRGAAYGVFELSRQSGVSPWYWWADVPAKKNAGIFVKNGTYTFKSPSVKYRGIFINDEAPAFSGWTKEKFGGVNHLVYEHMFELLLRLRGNYLWPAMWGNAFNDDDTLNPVLADKWGIVMGTSHHEPMLRAQQEWKRYGSGLWDYTKNDTVLRAFWTKGIQNMGSHESIVTIGMRGDGDMPMTQGTATTLLEKIVADQRTIIEKVTGKPAAETPQLWALYKEVQDYYDKGMRVPDDVTLLLCDDNWGNIRRLPKLTDNKRAGGYGIYYHFDYVGGPRNYKWLNTNNIARVWEQMHLAKEYGVDKIWIVNVGDLKPMEQPISFFLDYAYDTQKWNAANLNAFYTAWAKEQFGADLAKQIGSILKKYAQLSSRKKPEMLDAATYNLTEYGEAQRVLAEWQSLRKEAEKINGVLPAAAQDAYFQLVLHPITAFANLHELYHAVAMNGWYARQKSALANQWADKAKEFYKNDSLLSIRYNLGTSNGKWNHMMDQTHIGYRSWQEPRQNVMPPVSYINADLASSGASPELMGSTPLQPSDAVYGSSPVFAEKDGYISIEAAHYTKAVNTASIQWTVIPGIGKSTDGVTTFPVTASAPLSAASPRLEYEIVTSGKDSIKLLTYFSPTLNFQNAPNGLQFAVSVDDEQPQVISLNKEDNTGVWNTWVGNNNIIKRTSHYISKGGKHVIKYRMIDPGIVLQKLVIDLGGLKPSYLGPAETISKTKLP